MWGKILKKFAFNDNQAEISFFDVKEHYEAAFAEKAKARVNLKKFRSLMEKAEAMDATYRAQLMNAQSFQYRKVA